MWGGVNNFIGSNVVTCVISGGRDNAISDGTRYSFIGGGYGCSIAGVTTNAVIVGGKQNHIGNRCNYASILGGGYGNITIGAQSMIPGGISCLASGNYSFAAGRRAKAYGNGSFVWGDSSDFDINASTNEVVVRCLGGAYFFTGIDGAGYPTSGVHVASGSGSWTSWSDRNGKANFEEVNGRDVLQKLEAVPVTTWNYRTQDEEFRHMGPMAQDFYAAFGVGDTPSGITAIDADGVALAAIKGLHEMVKELQKDNQELRLQIEALIIE